MTKHLNKEFILNEKEEFNLIKKLDKALGNDVDVMLNEMPNAFREHALLLKSLIMSVIMQLFMKNKIILKGKIDE